MPAYAGDYDDGDELQDLDGDGLWDVLDVDDDGDGVPSNYEKIDADNDGIPDYMDPDSFGTYNAAEDEPDCEEGMIPDGSEDQQFCIDRDCDGIVNYIDDDWTDGPGEDGTGDPLCNYFS